jgi:hypothetical protein
MIVIVVVAGDGPANAGRGGEPGLLVGERKERITLRAREPPPTLLAGEKHRKGRDQQQAAEHSEWYDGHGVEDVGRQYRANGRNPLRIRWHMPPFPCATHAY